MPPYPHHPPDLPLEGIYFANNNTCLYTALDFDTPSRSNITLLPIHILIPFTAPDLMENYMPTSTLLFNGRLYEFSMPYTHLINITLPSNETCGFGEGSISALISNGVPETSPINVSFAVSSGDLEIMLPLINALPPAEKGRNMVFWLILEGTDWGVEVPGDMEHTYASYPLSIVETGEGGGEERMVYLPTHFRHIKIDGYLDDWGNITPYYDESEYENWSQDENGNGEVDIFGKDIDPRYLDIRSVRVANDLDNLYFAVEFAGNIEDTLIEKELGWAIVANAPQSSPYWNATPPMEPAHHTPEYEFIPPDKRMVDTGHLGFDAAYIFSWFSAFTEFTPYPDNHVRKFYQSRPYFTQVEVYTYRVAAAKHNVIELRIPLYDHGLDLKECNFTLEFAVYSYTLEAAIQPWTVDAVPYDNGINKTPGSMDDDTPLYFIYNITVGERDILSDAYNKDVSKCRGDIAGLRAIEGAEGFVDELNPTLIAIDKNWSQAIGSSDIDTMRRCVREIAALGSLVHLTYRALEYGYFAHKLNIWYDIDISGIDAVLSDISNIASLILNNTAEAEERIVAANDTIATFATDIGEKVPPIKVSIFDSEGTNDYDETAWSKLSSHPHMYGPFRVVIDHTSLDKENINLKDMLETNASVVVIDNAMDRGKDEILSPSEIEALKTYVAVYGGALIGTGNTLATGLIPEHKGLMTVFGLQFSKDTYASTPVSSEFHYRSDELIMRYNIEPNVYVSGVNMGMTGFELNHSRGEYIATSTDNDAAVIHGRYGMSDNVYFTLPVSKMRAYGESGNDMDAQMLYNAIVYASGLLKVSDIYTRITGIETDGFGVGAGDIYSTIYGAMHSATFHRAKAILQEFAYNTLINGAEDLLNRSKPLLDDIIDMEYPGYEELQTLYQGASGLLDGVKALNISALSVHENTLVMDALFGVYENVSAVEVNITYQHTKAKEWFESELNNAYTTLLAIETPSPAIQHLRAMIGEAYDAYYSGNYTLAREVVMEDVPRGIGDAYLQERSDIKRRIAEIESGNVLYSTQEAKRYLDKAERAYSEGNIPLAFKFLAKAKEAIVPGVPAVLPVALILIVLGIGFGVYISRGHRTPQISFRGLFRAHTHAKENINIGFINLTDSKLDGDIVRALRDAVGGKGSIYAICDEASIPGLRGSVPKKRTLLIVSDSQRQRRSYKGYSTLTPTGSGGGWLHDVLILLSEMVESEGHGNHVVGGNELAIFMNISHAVAPLDTGMVRSFLRHLVDRTGRPGLHLVAVFDATAVGMDNAYLYALDLKNTYKVAHVPKTSIFHYIKENRLRDYMVLRRMARGITIKTERIGNKTLSESNKSVFILVPSKAHVEGGGGGSP